MTRKALLITTVTVLVAAAFTVLTQSGDSAPGTAVASDAASTSAADAPWCDRAMAYAKSYRIPSPQAGDAAVAAALTSNLALGQQLADEAPAAVAADVAVVVRTREWVAGEFAAADHSWAALSASAVAAVEASPVALQERNFFSFLGNGCVEPTAEPTAEPQVVAQPEVSARTGEAAISQAELGAPAPTTIDTVVAAFEAYGTALEAADGIPALALVTNSTIERFEEYRILALTAAANQLAARPLADQLVVLHARLALDADTLASMDGAELFTWAISAGAIHHGFAGTITNGLGVVDGNFAELGVLPPDGIGELWPFRWERSAWRPAIDDLLELSEQRIAAEVLELAIDSQLETEAALLVIVSMQSGALAGPALYDVPA